LDQTTSGIHPFACKTGKDNASKQVQQSMVWLFFRRICPKEKKSFFKEISKNLSRFFRAAQYLDTPTRATQHALQNPVRQPAMERIAAQSEFPKESKRLSPQNHQILALARILFKEPIYAIAVTLRTKKAIRPKGRCAKTPA